MYNFLFPCLLLFDSRNIYAYKTLVFFLFFVCVVAFTVAFAIEVASVIVDIVIVAVDVVDVVVVVFVVVVLAVVGVTVASSVDEPKPFRFLFIIHIGYNFENNLILKLSLKKTLKRGKHICFHETNLVFMCPYQQNSFEHLLITSNVRCSTTELINRTNMCGHLVLHSYIGTVCAE